MDKKKEYAQLLASGMFFEMFPFLTGNWEDDREIFIELSKNKEI
jgi:hypothetical protein